MGVGQFLKYRTSRKSLSQPDSNLFSELLFRSGARGRNRTGMTLRSRDFKSDKMIFPHIPTNTYRTIQVTTYKGFFVNSLPCPITTAFYQILSISIPRDVPVMFR
jgi:hypothetical protein